MDKILWILISLNICLEILLPENAVVIFIHAEKFIPVSLQPLLSIDLFLFQHQTKHVENASI